MILSNKYFEKTGGIIFRTNDFPERSFDEKTYKIDEKWTKMLKTNEMIFFERLKKRMKWVGPNKEWTKWKKVEHANL